ncbi:uncharacterized protein LOC134265298 [Saccostrea cucullata]|uniref:uncharacterized protein LOC134265298 n=1 Tax=Saccostrea cuccullata TaxID=36930 RepID=UPI002ED2E357
MCVECRPGFRGFDCNLTCPLNHYGPGCRTQCNCNNVSEYCHHICGCISNRTKPLVIDNVTNMEHYDNITDIEQTLSMELCLSSIKNSIETKINNVGKNTGSINLHILNGVNVHNALYITQERNRENNTVSREDMSEDPLYGSCEDPCYSTLTLRVNYGPIYPCNQNGSSEDFNPYGYTYEGEGNVARIQGTNDNKIYVDKESIRTHISSTQGQYEDPWRNECNNSLLRHSSQRRFDLMPLEESYSAIRGKEYGPYELASSKM